MFFSKSRRPAVRRTLSGVVATSAALGLALASVSTAHAATAADRDRPSPRIIGGTEQADGAHPFMAAVLFKGKEAPTDRWFCGGSLISPTVVMTAAHCVVGLAPEEIETTVGRTVMSDESQGQLRNVSDIVVHPRYDNVEVNYDAAFLTLDKPVTGIAAVRLPTAGTDALIRPGALATVIGWGNTDTEITAYADRLRAVDVPILSHAECTATYPEYDKEIKVCAGVEGKDTCQGDSGGPMIRKIQGRVYQIGITSYGLGCAEQGAPGVYTYTGSDELWNSLEESDKGKKIKQLLGR
ncbi:S1 family peptidase [Streptomyces lincolnensis]|uniref:S1 family peptidase n=1 Tax=Streptomyces lincolnensis TaxID=1915 RepID=UPI0037D0F674